MPEGFSSLPPLNALRVFEVVARHLNFRLASEELGVTQAAVAQQVRGLERHLGLKLFERRPRGLGLTDEGRNYSGSVRTALALLNEATRSLKPEPSRVTVSVTPSLASRWLIPRLGTFAQAHADIDLRVLATDRLSRFQTDGVDIAIRYGRPPFGPGLEAKLFLEQRVIAVASPEMIAKNGVPTDIAHLQKFLLLHDAHNFWPEFIAGALREPMRPTARNMRFNQTSLAIEAAITGQGIALASRFFVNDDIASGRLTQIYPHEFQPDKAFYLVWPRRAQEAHALTTVRGWLVGQAAGKR
jgi:LysR family glycine cleavage system transcriptional activator